MGLMEIAAVHERFGRWLRAVDVVHSGEDVTYGIWRMRVAEREEGCRW
jgi:hypothetical protein